MQNKFFFIFLMLLVSLSFVSGAIENEVLIVDDNNQDTLAGPYAFQDGITSALYYNDIINNMSYNYEITYWNNSLNGSVSLNILQSYGMVIWSTGAFYDTAPSTIDQSTLESYVTQGGNLIISGEYMLWDSSQNSFTDNVLHAKSINDGYSSLYSINITNITHPVTSGFSLNEILNTSFSPGGYIATPDNVETVFSPAQTLAVRGGNSPNSGLATIMAFENETINSRTVYISFSTFTLNSSNMKKLVEDAVTWMDNFAPTVNEINLIPGDLDSIDPDVQINITANITDLHNVSLVKFAYRCAAAGGLCIPGTEVFANMTMVYNPTTKLYEDAFFTPNVPGTWQYRIWTNDSLGNENYTQIYNVSVEYDYTWTVTPSSFDTVSCLFFENCNLGSFTINNTGDYTLNFDLSSNYENTFFNVTPSFDLASNGVKIISVNATASDLNIESNIIITINSTTANANPIENTINTTFISYVGGPYFDVKITSYDETINQSHAMNLTAYVKNIGNEGTNETWFNWTLPSGWINISGNLSLYIGNLSPDEIAYNIILVNVSSLAPSGINTITVSASSLEGTNDSDSKKINVLCYSGDGVCGSGCTHSVDSDCPLDVITVEVGGGGGGGGGLVNKTINFSQIVEIVSGEEKSFDIEVYNKNLNSVLKNLTLNIKGFLPQYITVFPDTIDIVNPGERKNFTVNIRVPSYKESEEHTLEAVVTGYISPISGIGRTVYRKTDYVKLIIQEVDLEKSNISLADAENAIQLMKEKGFNVEMVENLLEEARKKLEERKNKEVSDLINSIIVIKETAFEVNDLIGRIKQVIDNPRKIKLITGDVVSEVVDEKGERFSISSILTGEAIFTSQSSQEILNLARAAFERGDYETAKERAQSAQTLLLLERKGNFGLFIYLYWYLILIGSFVFSVTGIFGLRKYQKLRVTQKIEDLNTEDKNLRKLINDLQTQYFSKKISSGEYHKILDQHQKKLVKIQKQRINFRNKRIRVLKPRKILSDLNLEKMQIESEIKKIQTDYYISKKISKREYELQFEAFNERLAEIEGEGITIHFLENQNKVKPNLKQPNKKEIERKLKTSILNAKKEIKKQEKFGVKSYNKNIFQKFKEWFVKISHKEDKRGIMFMDGEVLERLKKETEKLDCEGKWIKINLRDENEK